MPETKKNKLTKRSCTVYKQGSMRITVEEDGKWDSSLYVYDADGAADAIAVLDAARIDSMNANVI